MRTMPALLLLFIAAAGGCTAFAPPYPEALDARLAAYGDARPCCDDPSAFTWNELPDSGSVDVVIGRNSPAFEFQSGISHFAAFRLPPVDHAYRVRVRSLFDGPAGEGGSVFYPVLAMMDESFVVTRVSNLDHLRLEQGLTVPGGEPGLAVTAPFDPAVTAERYLVVFTPAVLLGAPPAERREGDMLTGSSRAWLDRQGAAIVEASPYGRLNIVVAPSDPPGPG